ncbi:carboxymuconolactone decarboxylase family protein [Streptomyces pluripotens]|uniref:Carboxymuconolactone decarboxylase family protein n=2 Tax=Streptomyces TaxID=1883 RepID=A0A221P8R1_9ACTN|nr:carboxymuconolactone decarboxylase family protein [Streptomyces pluripotens]ASN28587.1 carboxymuconolactone decarboxylase family protein [Streptomyces pluripotens]
MTALSAAAKRGFGDPVLAELVMIRASQLNHCAFCLDMHLRVARANGESEDRLQLLDAWEETGGLYSERERAALRLTESVTLLTDGFVPDAVYDTAARHFGGRELAHLIGLITVINSWNRLMVSRRVPPGGNQP